MRKDKKLGIPCSYERRKRRVHKGDVNLDWRGNLLHPSLYSDNSIPTRKKKLGRKRNQVFAVHMREKIKE